MLALSGCAAPRYETTTHREAPTGAAAQACLEACAARLETCKQACAETYQACLKRVEPEAGEHYRQVLDRYAADLERYRSDLYDYQFQIWVGWYGDNGGIWYNPWHHPGSVPGRPAHTCRRRRPCRPATWCWRTSGNRGAAAIAGASRPTTPASWPAAARSALNPLRGSPTARTSPERRAGRHEGFGGPPSIGPFSAPCFPGRPAWAPVPARRCPAGPAGPGRRDAGRRPGTWPGVRPRPPAGRGPGAPCRFAVSVNTDWNLRV
jgi:hypothetical protein